MPCLIHTTWPRSVYSFVVRSSVAMILGVTSGAIFIERANAQADCINKNGTVCCDRDEIGFEQDEKYTFCMSEVKDPMIDQLVWWSTANRTIRIHGAFETCDKSCVGGTTAVQLESALRDMMSVWNNVKSDSDKLNCSDIQLIYEGQSNTQCTNLFPKPCPPDTSTYNVVVWREDDWRSNGEDYRDPTVLLALTVLKYNSITGQITDADIDFNGRDYNWTATSSTTCDDTKNAGRCDKSAIAVQSVMLHELGHVIGFAHHQSRQSVMYPKNQSETTTPSAAIDVQGLCTAYPTAKRTPWSTENAQGGLVSGVSFGSCSVTRTSANACPWEFICILLTRIFVFRRGRKENLSW